MTVAVVGLSVVISRYPGELGEWMDSTWGFAKQILPLLLCRRAGGRRAAWPARTRGADSVAVGRARQWEATRCGANLFASVAGAFMYFATLTEVPILEGLIGNGMGQGPALALLLAGPALSLPNMLVIASVIGWKKDISVHSPGGGHGDRLRADFWLFV